MITMIVMQYLLLSTNRYQNGDHYGYWATGVSTSNLSARVNYIRIKDHAGGGNIQDVEQ